MKQPRTEQAFQRAGARSHKNVPLFGIAVLCLLLVCGVCLTASLLGSGISRFSKQDDNVIPLVPPEEAVQMEAAPVEEVTPARPAPAQAEALPAVTPEVQSTEPAAAPEPTASTASAGNSTSAASSGSNTSAVSAGNNAGAAPSRSAPRRRYWGELRVEDDTQIWGSETQVDLFRSSYDGTVESADGEKVIAPGTSNYYDFTLKNNGNIPLDYEISLQVDTYLGEDETYSAIPLEWRLLTGDRTPITDWRNYNERTEVLREETLEVRHQENYAIEWRWSFERGMDEADTEMGNLAVAQPLGAKATIYVYAEQSADWVEPVNPTPGGTTPDGTEPGGVLLPGILDIPYTGDSSQLLFYILLTAGCVCGLVLVVLWTRRKKDEEPKDGET